jgi:hypothetical protein
MSVRALLISEGDHLMARIAMKRKGEARKIDRAKDNQILLQPGS